MFAHRSFLRIGQLPDISINGLLKDGYELQNYSWSLSQSVDQKGKAQSEVNGGSIRMLLSSFPPMDILKWAMNARKYESGLIIVCDADNMPIHKIMFNNAACVGMEINYALHGTGYVTTQLLILAEQLSFAEVVLKNRWIK